MIRNLQEEIDENKDENKQEQLHGYVYDKCDIYNNNCPFYHFYHTELTCEHVKHVDDVTKFQIFCNMCHIPIKMYNMKSHLTSDSHILKESNDIFRANEFKPKYLQDGPVTAYILNPAYNLVEHFKTFHFCHKSNS